MSGTIVPNAAALPRGKGKNIVICLDGTGNRFEHKRTNVLKLFQVCVRDATQVVYYDPGVGTLGDASFKTKIGRGFDKLMGDAFGAGLMKNVEQAYAYLMEQYAEGDSIFLFGFSRGAYTARTLAAFISYIGLLEKEYHNLMPYASELFLRKAPDPAHKVKTQQFHSNREAFKRTYRRRSTRDGGNVEKIPIEFLGLWDTVKSYGWIDGSLRLPLESGDTSVKTIRHAMAIDEERAFFPQMAWRRKGVDQDLREVWFPGVHQDVGGGYSKSESGLSKFALSWMLEHAKRSGLRYDEKAAEVLAGLVRPIGASSPSSSALDAADLRHGSLKGWWWLAEALPWRDPPVTGAEDRKRPLHWWPRSGDRRARKIPECAVIHPAVLDRMSTGGQLEVPPGFWHRVSRKTQHPAEDETVEREREDGSEGARPYKPTRMPELTKFQLQQLNEKKAVLIAKAPARLLLPLADGSGEVLMLALTDADVSVASAACGLLPELDGMSSAEAVDKLAKRCEQAMDEALAAVPTREEDPAAETGANAGGYRHDFIAAMKAFKVPKGGGPAPGFKDKVQNPLSELMHTQTRLGTAQKVAIREKCAHLVDALAVVASRHPAATPAAGPAALGCPTGWARVVAVGEEPDSAVSAAADAAEPHDPNC